MGHALCNVIAMDSLGNQISLLLLPGNAPAQLLEDLLSALIDLHLASGGTGLMFRVIKEPSPEEGWQQGQPPKTINIGNRVIWVVKTTNQGLPEEVVVVNRFGDGFIRLIDYHGDTESPPRVENITHHRPLTENEKTHLEHASA